MSILPSVPKDSSTNSSQSNNSRDRRFWTFLSIAGILALFATPYPNAARWVGFTFAAYAAVSNDSIQTIGTFLASNRHRPWWMLWLFIGGIFLATVGYSWMTTDVVGAIEMVDGVEQAIPDGIPDGDVSNGRLASKGFSETPMSFKVVQVIAPLILLALTRLKMPVSTTFLLLTAFSTKGTAVVKVMEKSLTGYLLAFVIALLVWVSLSRLFKKLFVGKASPVWSIFQWCTTGFLWSVWIMQDAANIAVFLPRSLSPLEFCAFAGTVFFGLGWMFYRGGERIQEVVEEKSEIFDVRAATVIDFIYALILYYFKLKSNIPMSTTWVFLGLLAGRELGMSLSSTGTRDIWGAIRLMLKDATMALIGLAISLGLAYMANPSLFMLMM